MISFSPDALLFLSLLIYLAIYFSPDCKEFGLMMCGICEGNLCIGFGQLNCSSKYIANYFQIS